MKDVDWGLLPVILTGITTVTHTCGVYGWEAGVAALSVLSFIFTCFCYFSMNLHTAINNKAKESRS